MILKMRVHAAEEQQWKNGPVQLLTLLDISEGVRSKNLFEMSTSLDKAKHKTADLPDKEVTVAVTEVNSMNGRVILRGSFDLAKPNNSAK